MDYQYDLIVIGAGPGGYDAAIFAAKKGLKTLLIEKDSLGGTCLNRGCIPTKTYLHAVKSIEAIKEGAISGIQVNDYSIDLKQMHTHKNEVVMRLRSGIETLLKKNKVEVRYGQAQIIDNHIVCVNNENKSSKFILIATGSTPIKLNIQGHENIELMTSDSLLDNVEPITHLAIVGGGVIGCEFAAMYAALGTKVTLIEMADGLLSTLDKEIGQSIKMQFKSQGIEVLNKTTVLRIEKNNTLIVKVKDEEVSIVCDKVLLATGRKANFKNLYCDKINLAVDDKRILVDTNFKTNIDNIYAIGDVSSKIQLAHLASAQGINAVCAMLNIEKAVNCDTLASCIYTHPEIASVGLTLEEANELKIVAKAFKVPTAANGKNTLSNQPRGFVKIIVNIEDKTIIGAILMCAHATDMIFFFVQAINSKLSLNDLNKSVYPHPTFSESIKEVLHLACDKVD